MKNFYSLIWQGLDNRHLEQLSRGGLRASLAGACIRKIYYLQMGERPELKPQNHLWPLPGIALHEAFEALLSHVDGLEFEVPIEIPIQGGSVTGTADIVGPDFIADLKFVMPKSWARIQAKPKPEHEDQVNLYAFSCQKARCILIYISLADLLGIGFDGSVYRGQLPRLVHKSYEWGADQEKGRKALAKYETVASSIERGVVPARPYKDWKDNKGTIKSRAIDRFPCKWCEFKNVCWG